MGSRTRVVIEDLSNPNHPKCKHGPMLLFSQKTISNGIDHRFYACSAFRDGKLNCANESIGSMVDANANDNENQMRLMMSKMQQIMNVTRNRRGYCFDCKQLLLLNEFAVHQGHCVKKGIEDSELKRPTTLLNPISNDKREAQYFFTESTLKCIASIMKHVKLNKIICIGAPRLHEYLKSNYDCLSIDSILLDLDDRYRSFYGIDEFLRYNMFNNYFFDGIESEKIFHQFLIESNNSRICLFTDPPFGCRTEPLTHTIKQISMKYQQLNSSNHILPVMWIFPYFMETYIRNEMPEMEMVDYKINYTNHKLYHDGKDGLKQGSPIRLFTNIPLNLIVLPESEGYRFCGKCLKWSAAENTHCNRCRICPSKNGSTYRHCYQCEDCVKQNYRHCEECGRCAQVFGHKCNDYQMNLTCWICRVKGHNEVNCKKWILRQKKNGVDVNVLRSKMLKCGKRICLICGLKGHNEKRCSNRRKILKENSFMNVTRSIFVK